jgi:hypothetical protein
VLVNVPVASITNPVAGVGGGVATGVNAGTSTITATYGTYTGIVGLADRTAILTVTAAAPVPVVLALNLRDAATFGIAASAGMTSTGIATINGDVALTPTPTCTDATGLPGNCAVTKIRPPSATGLTVNGSIYWAGDPFDNGRTASAVRSDLNLAWLEGKAKPSTGTLGGVLGGAGPAGKIIAPGVYTESSTLNCGVGTFATFDGTTAGQPNLDAVWIIQVGSSLTDAGNCTIKLANGAQARNIWFVVQSDVSIGTGTTWNGNILAGNSVTILAGSTVNGRILSGADTGIATGAVSLSGGAVAPGIVITVPQ